MNLIVLFKVVMLEKLWACYYVYINGLFIKLIKIFYNLDSI